ncbi:hypothetical protein GMSM_17800 [Geomonas sp. Red276]
MILVSPPGTRWQATRYPWESLVTTMEIPLDGKKRAALREIGPPFSVSSSRAAQGLPPGTKG